MTRDPLRSFPERVPCRNAEGTRHYQRCAAGFAAKEPVDPDAPCERRELLGEGYLVCEGAPAGPASAQCAPLYRIGSGPKRVLTGRVFVVAGDEASFQRARSRIESSGFRISARPRSAPGGAWLEPSGTWAEALSAIESLVEIDELEIVQPEALLERREKDE